jgi:hypothetical protein
MVVLEINFCIKWSHAHVLSFAIISSSVGLLVVLAILQHW